MSTKIPGIRVGIGLTCLVGGFFANRPWMQSPNYSYLSYFSCYALVFNIVSGLAVVDFIITAQEFLSHRSLSDRIFGLTLAVSAHFFCWSYKIINFTKANIINRFWSDLVLSDKDFSKDLSRSWLYFKILFIFQLAIAIVHLVLHPFYSSLVKEFRIIVSVKPYNRILLLIFVTFPSVVLNQFSFWYVVTATFYLLFTIESFYNGLKEQVRLRNLKLIPSLRITLTGNVRKIPFTNQYPEIQLQLEETCTSPGKVRSKEEILATFKNIRYLCNSFSFAVAPVYLLVIVSSVVVLVHSMAFILLNGLPSNDAYGLARFIYGCSHVLYEASRLTAILVGGIFHRRVEQLKEELWDDVFLMETSIYKAEMENIFQLVSMWNWRITAWGVFIVDRHVLAGVMSGVVSYVVIFFQITLSDNQLGSTLNLSNCTDTSHIG